MRLGKEKASRWGKRSAEVRLEAALKHHVDYPVKREHGKIISEANGQRIVVDLIPAGHCTQWLAVFDGVPWKVAGLSKIHSEIRRRMPPRLSDYNL